LFCFLRVNGTTQLDKVALSFKIGILRKLSPRVRRILLEKSLLDVWSDIVYFPSISKIIGAFVRTVVVKPPPEKIHEEFEHLSPNFQRILKTKGLLHLAPSEV
jgi:hypothetical protein